MTTFQITSSVDGAVTSDVFYDFFTKGDPYPTFPLEVPFLNLPDGALVQAVFQKGTLDCGTSPHTVETNVVAGKTLLLRAPIAVRCNRCDIGITCSASTTCSYDTCVAPFVSPNLLEEYVPNWAIYSGCKPLVGGFPVVTLGGDTFNGWKPLSNGDIVKLVEGGQGGFHVWISLRMRYFDVQPIVKLRATLPGLGVVSPDILVSRPFPIDPSTGDCQLTLYPLRLDPYVNDPANLLGQTLTIDVTVLDQNAGASGATQRTVQIDQTL